MKADELMQTGKQDGRKRDMKPQDLIICPKCKRAMDCPPGEILNNGLIWLAARCQCGNNVSGYSGEHYGLLCILDENMNRITLTPDDFENPWHPCHYSDMHLVHDGTWEDEKWYEWVDKFGNREVARMKLDAEDHFFPASETIRKEYVIGFREAKE